MLRRFAKLAIGYALLCYLGFLCFDGFIFLVSHLPPQVVHLDWFISWLGALSRVLTLPRRLLRHLWPGETSPTALNYLLSALNWLFWGTLAAAWKIHRDSRRP